MSEKLYWSKISTHTEYFTNKPPCPAKKSLVPECIANIQTGLKSGWNTVGMSREKYLGKHVTDLVKDGVFQYSVTMEVLKTKQITDMEADRGAIDG